MAGNHNLLERLRQAQVTDGGKMFDFGTTVPSSAAGYAKGCLFLHTDGSDINDMLYQNVGTLTTSDFESVSTLGELALANTKIMVGNASGRAAAVSMSGDATIANTGAVTIAAGSVEETMLSTATQDKIGYLTIVGADLASSGTGTITIQLKDAAGNNLAARALVRTWIGTADDFGPDALTDYSVSTGTEKEEVTANAEYLAITDATGLIVMAVDKAGGAAGSVYAWAEVGGRIVASGEVALTAPG